VKHQLSHTDQRDAGEWGETSILLDSFHVDKEGTLGGDHMVNATGSQQLGVNFTRFAWTPRLL
jgi:hypothetical protein